MRKQVLLLGSLGVALLTLSGCSQNEPVSSTTTGTKPLTVDDIKSSKQTTSPPIQSDKTPTNVMTTTPSVSFDPSDRSYSNQYQGAILHTNKGDITVKFLATAPMAVNNFLKLADHHFYDGILFHRVIKGFMIQGGDPNSKLSDWSQHGTGGPGYTFADELDNKPLTRGALAMANAGPNTNGSQFFILTAPTYSGPYTHFGEVTVGMDVVDAIEGVQTNDADHPLQNVSITGIELVKK